MKPKIDKEKCIGCGTCASLCGEVFELKDGHAQVIAKDDTVIEKNKDEIKQAVEACPVQAISLE